MPIVAVIGLEDGDPFNSIRDLRGARSLNPHADISPGMCEAIGEVRLLAFVQCCEQHHDHDYYAWECASSRERVRQIRSRNVVSTAERIRRAPVVMPDTLAA